MIVKPIIRLVIDDSGQDLIEYALLSGIITAAGVALFPVISQAMGEAYTGWQSGAQAAWEPCPPGGC
jgi:Flp pilus assembly pilin Flp